ncbi:polyprotein [Phytophthora megakarya]|uniref:Polyprotein n=1 Tax=Phytophthora megakarya TaxID=4795 RepID=A0A225WJX6_9STRA|nr:polyprotein [Phytophthora megakarya]
MASKEGVSVDPRKTEAIAKFIYDFADLARPLSELSKASTRWIWSKSVDEGYLRLKLALHVTTDALGHCIVGVLSQRYDGADHIIAFYSKKLNVHERGWPTHGKEIMPIKVATEKWRHYLHGRPLILHHPQVSPKMARFLTHFSQFDALHHGTGKINVVADALSRPLRDEKDEEEG